MDKILKAGIIGAGNVGSLFAHRIAKRQDIELKAVCDVCADAAKKAGEKYKARFFTDYSKMLNETLDVVLVCTTNSSHAACVMACAAAGVPNIYCEKPLCLNMEAADKMIKAVREKKIRTSMGFGGRLEAPFPLINNLFQSGKMGELMSCWTQRFRGYGFYEKEIANARHPAVAFPEISGGWAVHHACHSVFWLMQIGGEVKEVYAKTLKSKSSVPSEELVWALIAFKAGRTGVLSDSICAFRGTRMGIIGSEATLLVIDEDDDNPSTDIEIRIRYEGRKKDEIIMDHYNHEKADLLNEFVAAIKNDLPSPVGFEEGKENLKVCFAIQESAKTSKPVKL